MKDRLCVISTKNPKKKVLLRNIANVKLYYDEFDIVIIDSNSDDISCFEFVPNDCIIEYCKNKNWELGAWNYAFNKYNNYKIYMFIQDGLIPKERIPHLDKINYDNGTIYTCNYWATLSQGGYFEELVNLYKNTELDFISNMHPDTWITGGAHSFFIINNENVKDILKLENVYIEKNLIKSKIDSWLAERTVGILANLQKNRIDVWPYFEKISSKRDY